jgi:beta-N-acetylhexosaminidase
VRSSTASLVVLALVAAACSDAPDSATTLLPTSATAPATPTPTTTAPSGTTTSTAPATTTSRPDPATTTEPLDVRRLAHSILLIGLPGSDLDQATADRLAAGAAGLILFAANIEGAAGLRELTGAAACAADRPLLIAVDQELGPVARLAGLVTPLPTNTEAQSMSPLELELTGQLLGEEMLDLGVNVDLAPVIDVVQGYNPVLADRHLGADPRVVGELGAAFLQGLRQAGVIAVPKHFPGHGRSTTDPHGGVVRIEASLADLAAVDFPPFAAVFAAGAAAVMVGHPIYQAIDPDLPASLSSGVLSLLRLRFGFDGVAVTDSLSMAGVAEGRAPGELAVLALAAGEDLLLVVDPAQVQPMVAAIVAAVATGDLMLERLQEASARVDRLVASAAPVLCPA